MAIFIAYVMDQSGQHARPAFYCSLPQKTHDPFLSAVTALVYMALSSQVHTQDSLMNVLGIKTPTPPKSYKAPPAPNHVLSSPPAPSTSSAEEPLHKRLQRVSVILFIISLLICLAGTSCRGSCGCSC